MHSTDNLDDGYIGSGKILGYSRNKYGDENHIIERLEFVSSRDELKRREKEIVNEELLAHPLNINLKYGGEGGWDHIDGSHLTKEIRSCGGKSAMAALNKIRVADTEEGRMFRSKLSKSMSIAKTGKPSKGIIHSVETKKKIAESMKAKQDGNRNSQHGTRWVNKNNTPLKIKESQLTEYLSDGYSLGRKNRICN
jgi:hypothetical protein